MFGIRSLALNLLFTARHTQIQPLRRSSAMDKAVSSLQTQDSNHEAHPPFSQRRSPTGPTKRLATSNDKIRNSAIPSPKPPARSSLPRKTDTTSMSPTLVHGVRQAESFVTFEVLISTSPPDAYCTKAEGARRLYPIYLCALGDAGERYVESHKREIVSVLTINTRMAFCKRRRGGFWRERHSGSSTQRFHSSTRYLL